MIGRRVKVTIFNISFAWKYDHNATPGCYLDDDVPLFETALLHGAVKGELHAQRFKVAPWYKRLLDWIIIG